MGDDFLDQPLSRFFESVASASATPGGGSAAAVTVALAAGLSAMAARLSVSQLQGSAQLVDEAERLRQRATELAQEDMMAFEAVHAAYALPKDREPGVRRLASAGLMKRKDVCAEVSDLLADGLRDPDPQVCANMAHVCCRLESLPAEVVHPRLGRPPAGECDQVSRMSRFAVRGRLVHRYSQRAGVTTNGRAGLAGRTIRAEPPAPAGGRLQHARHGQRSPGRGTGSMAAA